MAQRTDQKESAGHLEGPRALRPEEHPSTISLLNLALRPNGPHAILDEYPLVLRKENIENMRVMVKDGEIVSHAAIYFSRLHAGDLTFKIGGVGSVATHPAHQKQGLASAVMRDCLDIMQKAECHLSVLWTQRHDFYRSLGYETAGSEYLYRMKASDFTRISSDCRVIPYTPEYLSDIIRIHEREAMRTERTAAEYETYLAIPKVHTLLATRGNHVTAYAIMGKGEDFQNCIHEWGGDAKDLLCLIREFALPRGTSEFILLAPSYQTNLTQLLEKMRIPKVFEYLAMMRIIDIEGLSSMLQDQLTPRIGKEFGIREVGQGFTIKIGAEEVPVADGRMLVRVLFGPDPLSSLLGGLSNETASALEEILPIPLFIWGLDSV